MLSGNYQSLHFLHDTTEGTVYNLNTVVSIVLWNSVREAPGDCRSTSTPRARFPCWTLEVTRRWWRRDASWGSWWVSERRDRKRKFCAWSRSDASVACQRRRKRTQLCTHHTRGLPVWRLAGPRNRGFSATAPLITSLETQVSPRINIRTATTVPLSQNLPNISKCYEELLDRGVFNFCLRGQRNIYLVLSFTRTT